MAPSGKTGGAKGPAGMLARKAATLVLVAAVVRTVLTYAVPKREIAELQWVEMTPANIWGKGATGGQPVNLTEWLAQNLDGEAARVLASAKSDRDMQRALFLEEDEWKNKLVLGILPQAVQRHLETWPIMARSWLRSYLAACGIYLGLGSAWAYYIYFVYGSKMFPKGNVPRSGDVLEQMKVSMLALPLYSMLPPVCECIVEKGWTLAYARIDEYGWHMYILFFIIYMAFVEMCVYWNHRLLHDVKVGYTTLHYIHHKYNKGDTLSPFAGLAFHPLDGIIQALPYFWTLFFVPMHSLTYELMLFGTAVWTTNIHDNIDGDCAPIMGAAYHTIHHTTYRHNHGQFFIYMDKIFGTLLLPEQESAYLKRTAVSNGK